MTLACTCKGKNGQFHTLCRFDNHILQHGTLSTIPIDLVLTVAGMTLIKCTVLASCTEGTSTPLPLLDRGGEVPLHDSILYPSLSSDFSDNYSTSLAVSFHTWLLPCAQFICTLEIYPTTGKHAPNSGNGDVLWLLQ